MKKNYIIPQAEQQMMATERPLAGSDDLKSGGDVNGINFGGVSDGTLMPEVKRGYNVWDDDWSQ